MRPTVHVVAGPNGAGKTTFATEYLASLGNCEDFLNADLIAAGLAPFAPETQNVAAARLLLQRVRELAERRANFGFETTFSGRTYVHLLRRMKQLGYHLHVYFLWLPSAELAIERVARRVQQGGHDIPTDDIRRRYAAGLENWRSLYRPLANAWWQFNAAELPPRLVSESVEGVLGILCQDVHRRIEQE